MKRTILCVLLLLLILAIGCTKPVSEVKSEDMIGEVVTLQGTADNAIKLGELSGYTLTDESGSIGIVSKSLPEEGSKVTVKGTVEKSPLFGIYINADK